MIGFRRKIDVIVYTMGKVGSSTVSTSIDAAGLLCLDVHFLQKERFLTVLSAYFNDPDMDIIPEHILDSMLARNAIIKQNKVRIISLIRNPIMRNISAVFQNTLQRSVDGADAILARLQAYPVRTPDYWFETDFIPMTGIDVFKESIDNENDHFRFSNGKIEVLLLKLEADDDRKSALISDFIGKPTTLTRTNEASTKWYFDLYRMIADDPRAIRSSYIEECLNLKYFRKFYSPREISEFANRFS